MSADPHGLYTIVVLLHLTRTREELKTTTMQTPRLVDVLLFVVVFQRAAITTAGPYNPREMEGLWNNGYKKCVSSPFFESHKNNQRFESSDMISNKSGCGSFGKSASLDTS